MKYSFSQLFLVTPANDTPTLRLIPLLCTADLRAHSEIGLTSAGGRKGCRRCEVIGTYIPPSNHYYYDHFLHRYHNPPTPRTTHQNRIYGQEADAAGSETERRSLTKTNGVTGESIFYSFFDLCGFDPVNDLVIDVMHSLCLNLIRPKLEKHLLAELGANQSVPILDRDTNVGGVLVKILKPETSQLDNRTQGWESAFHLRNRTLWKTQTRILES